MLFSWIDKRYQQQTENQRALFMAVLTFVAWGAMSMLMMTPIHLQVFASIEPPTPDEIIIGGMKGVLFAVFNGATMAAAPLFTILPRPKYERKPPSQAMRLKATPRGLKIVFAVAVFAVLTNVLLFAHLFRKAQTNPNPEPPAAYCQKHSVVELFPNYRKLSKDLKLHYENLHYHLDELEAAQIVRKKAVFFAFALVLILSFVCISVTKSLLEHPKFKEKPSRWLLVPFYGLSSIAVLCLIIGLSFPYVGSHKYKAKGLCDRIKDTAETIQKGEK